MASPRVLKVADQIKVIVAEMLERRIKDPRLGFVTVTDVRLTGDSREATVFYTVLGSDAEQTGTAAALASATGLIRSQVGKQLGHEVHPDDHLHRRRHARNARQLDDLLDAGPRGRRPGGRAGGRRDVRGRRDPYKHDDEDDDGGRRLPRPSRSGTATSRSAPAWSWSTRRPGWTSHQVVGRVRRLGSAPARSATPARSTRWPPGSCVVGVNRATRLLGHLMLTDKTYTATIRLGQATVTDDAEGDVLTAAGAAGLGDDQLADGAGPAARRHPPGADLGLGDQGQRCPVLRQGPGR